MAASVAITLLVALGILRWLAPGLLGIAPDLQLVRVGRTLPPFFEGVFRPVGEVQTGLLVNDPYTLVRSVPLLPELFSVHQGPTDVLGFRNRAVPNVADVVAIGDSQTYGHNATLAENWPSRLRERLAEKSATVYSMAVGGWGAVQYLDMLPKAMRFRPRCVIVAYYTGNDSLETFQLAYAVPHWRDLVPDPSLSESDMPPTPYPAPREDWWSARFADGSEITFTPALRLASNLAHPAVRAGYAIMAETARRAHAIAEQHQVELVFTVIPTKELVYAPRVEREGIAAPEEYRELVRMERGYIDELAAAVRSLEGAAYVDLVAPLQEAAVGGAALYPEDIDGHPLPAGYSIIADALAPAVDPSLPAPPRGLVALRAGEDLFHLMLVDDEGVWPFASEEVIRGNGWRLRRARRIEPRDIAGLPIHATVDEIDPVRFGPRALRGEAQAAETAP
jgi:lysophospholipase L1-like esterase